MSGVSRPGVYVVPRPGAKSRVLPKERIAPLDGLLRGHFSDPKQIYAMETVHVCRAHTCIQTCLQPAPLPRPQPCANCSWVACKQAAARLEDISTGSKQPSNTAGLDQSSSPLYRSTSNNNHLSRPCLSTV